MRRLIVVVAVVLAMAVARQATAVVITLNPCSEYSGTDGCWSPPDPRDGVFEQLWGGDPAASLLPGGLTDERFALEYDISAIPSSATIALATLAFTEAVDAPYETRSLYGYVGDGVVDLNDMLATTSLLIPQISDGEVGTTVLPVTAFISSRVSHGDPYAGFMCRQLGESLAGYYQIYASPSLTVTYTVVPEPSTLVLLATGAVSLLACAWRRRGQVA
jgi:hypothetical protein